MAVTTAVATAGAVVIAIWLIAATVPYVAKDAKAGVFIDEMVYNASVHACVMENENIEIGVAKKALLMLSVVRATKPTIQTKLPVTKLCGVRVVKEITVLVGPLHLDAVSAIALRTDDGRTPDAPPPPVKTALTKQPPAGGVNWADVAVPI